MKAVWAHHHTFSVFPCVPLIKLGHVEYHGDLPWGRHIVHWSNEVVHFYIWTFLTTAEAAWWIISVVSVCLYVCLFICQTKTFESLDIGSSYLHFGFISREYGSSSYMKVIGSRSRSREQKDKKKSHCKILIISNSGSQHRHMKFACSITVYGWRIECGDRHLCRATGSDHAWLNARIRGWSALDYKEILWDIGFWRSVHCV